MSDVKFNDYGAKNHVLQQLLKIELLSLGEKNGTYFEERKLNEKIRFASGGIKYTNELLSILNNILDDANSIENREQKLICLISILKVLLDNIGATSDSFFEKKLHDYKRELYEIQVKNERTSKLLQSIAEKI
jgi:hypothetical protein